MCVLAYLFDSGKSSKSFREKTESSSSHNSTVGAQLGPQCSGNADWLSHWEIKAEQQKEMVPLSSH